MWSYEKRLQFPVNITTPNAKLAQVIISQYGGPDGEMGASMRYLSQRYAAPYREVASILTDIGVSVTKLRILGFKFTPEGRTLRSLCFFNNLHR
ncbi:MAG: manganese catalase family protein, partial [Lachnospiraceae bacterium]|nr:manganese catalase family protein [Lachnospiraceae bacterium]